MWFHRLTDYLLKHRWQALVLTFLITYIPVLGMASTVMAALMTLCEGPIIGAAFTLAASLPVVLVLLAPKTPHAPAILITVMVMISTGSNVLMWIFAMLLRRRCSWSFILQIGALLGVLAISILHLANPQIAEWWGTQLQSFYNQSVQLAGLVQAGKTEALNEMQWETINTIKSYATGILMAYLLLSALLPVMIARWWQMVVVKSSQLGRELQYIRLSHLAGVLFIFSIIFYYLENSVVLDILPVLCLLFGAAGLSLVHYLCWLMGPAKGRFWLLFLYFVMMYSLISVALLPFLSALNMVFLVVIGLMLLTTCLFMFIVISLVDVWFDVRKRVRKV